MPTTARYPKPPGDPDSLSLWVKLAEPLPTDDISWRQDGRPTERDGKHFARFVAYIDAQTVRERLDAVVPGEWDLTLELLPGIAAGVDEAESDQRCAFKARLQVLGVIREDVGSGENYKNAATDAFKRAAVRFGIGHELYSFGVNYVQVDGDGKYAKPLEDPGAAYARRAARKLASIQGRESTGGGAAAPAPAAASGARSSAPASSASPAPRPTPRAPAPAVEDPTTAPTSRASSAAPGPEPVGAQGPRATDEVTCPKCGGRMWDNRLSKRNAKAPDYKCRDRGCDGVIWPTKQGNGAARPAARTSAKGPVSIGNIPGLDDDVPPPDDDDAIPF